MIKLKTVKVEFDIVIAVKEGQDVNEIAYLHIKDAIYDMSTSDFIISVLDYSPNNARGWNKGCIPYGDTGNTRIDEYLRKENI